MSAVDEEVHRYYDRVRERIAHEDSLVHNRLSWLLTINGFLFSAYGISISPLFKDGDKSSIGSVQAVIGGVGVITSFLVLLGVSAAFYALRRNVRTFHEKFGRSEEVPDLIGGKLSGTFGIGCALLIPVVVGIAWMVLAETFRSTIFVVVSIGAILTSAFLLVYPFLADRDLPKWVKLPIFTRTKDTSAKT